MPCRWEEIQKQIAKLEKRHAVHIASYGEGNERRLTGKHETSSMHDFRCGHEWHAPCSYMPANLQEALREGFADLHLKPLPCCVSARPKTTKSNTDHD